MEPLDRSGCVDGAPPASEDAAPRRTAFLRTGNPRPALVAAVDASRRGGGTLALVLEALGSTYVRAGAMAVFGRRDEDRDDGPGEPVGWLSGGCLEPVLAQRAMHADREGRLDWIEIDTREDADLFAGSATGCRGRLRIALLPLRLLHGAAPAFDAWSRGGTPLQRVVCGDGRVVFEASGGHRFAARMAAAPPPWPDPASAWTLPLPRPPEALLLGAGPETAPLLRLLRDLGWRTTAIDPRPRWAPACTGADACEQAAGIAQPVDAALVMHHSFERDLDALERLAMQDVPFIGLLGPPRRRDDLLSLLPATCRDALRPRLHAPVGLDLGGQGPEAIALSIAAQLQAWRARGSGA